MEEQTEHQEKKGLRAKVMGFHDKHYKLLLLVPAIIFLFSIIYLGVFYTQNHDFIHRDISLTGGTSVTLYDKISATQLTQDLSGQLEELDAREISDLITQEQKGVIIETKSDADTTRQVLGDYLGYTLTDQNSSFEFTGSSLSQSFFKQLVIAVIIAFLLMAIVVFLLFRTFIPSLAVIISAFADILMTLVLFDILGMKLSSAGIVAFLMLIGYSVDTDILLTNRVLRRHGESINKKIWGAFKTGMTMTLTSLFAIVFALILTGSFSNVLTQIFLILIIGLAFDMMNTWVTNASIIKWYAITKEKHEA